MNKKRRTKLQIDFGILEDARHAAGLSREEVAVALGVSFITIYRWERNQNVPDLVQVIGLSRALGVPMSDLFTVKEVRA